MDQHKALELQKKLRITCLSQTLLSPEATKLFNEGWKFAGVLRNGEGQYNSPCREYTTIQINNQWNDKALFIRHVAEPKQDPIETKHSIYEYLE